MGYEGLLATAAETQRVSAREVRGANEKVPIAIDALLKLPHFIATSESDLTGFRWWANSLYASTGHTAGALFSLWLKGFYLEATVLLRHEVEVLVQLRYFGERRDELVNHLTRKLEVNFRKMFNTCAPGFHDPWYGMLAGAAHGGVAATILRMGMVTVQRQWTPGCHFDEARASMLLNQLAPTLLGFLNLFPKHFPECVDLMPRGVREQHKAAVQWLEKVVEANLQQFPQQKSWLLPMLRLAEYSPRGAT
jgi:hypothetical protein